MPFDLDCAKRNLERYNFPRDNPVIALAEKIESELKDPEKAGKYPFNEIVHCNTRNPQLMGQKPIKFINEVLALAQNQGLYEEHSDAFKPEVVKRARELIESTENCGLGAYTVSAGLDLVLRDVISYINKRDDLPNDYLSKNNVFLTDGSSSGIRLCLQMFIDAKSPRNSGYLIPTPQCNIYRECLNTMGSIVVPYKLNEEAGWDVCINELENAYSSARSNGIQIKGIVVINPGNPTGGLLSKEKIRAIINFAVEKKIIIFADETLQTATSSEGNFISFQRVSYEYEQEMAKNEDMNNNDKVNPQIISFNSFSRGVVAYAGIRSGYFILHNFETTVKDVFTKMVSINLCPNTTGQILVSLGLRGATEGTEEEMEYQKEKKEIQEALENSMKLAYTKLNAAEGIVCQKIMGGNYAFPRITVPTKALTEAKKEGLTGSEFYCKCLLEQTGILIEAGSSFMCVSGNNYVRISLLRCPVKFGEVLDKIVQFNNKWIADYSA